jgi:hypothetical protein
MRLPLRPQMLAVLTFALVWLAAVVPVAEASFPAGNGLIAFAGEGPPFNTKRVPEGAWTIRVVNPRSGRARQLTYVPRRCSRRGWTWSDSEPSYSASGRLLAYVHEDSCDPRTADGLYIMRADGSGRRLIRRTTSDEDDLPEYPAISPSGRLLAFDQYLGSTYITSATRPDGERDLGLDCPALRRRCPLWRYSEPQQPAWSPNGRRLALTLSGPDGQGELGIGDIGTVGTRGLGLRLVTRSTGDGMPDWSPTGDRIVFERVSSLVSDKSAGSLARAGRLRSRHLVSRLASRIAVRRSAGRRAGCLYPVTGGYSRERYGPRGRARARTV